jgi:hypothetical protein
VNNQIFFGPLQKEPVNMLGEDLPEKCIECNSKIITLVKKLPRTFKCNKGHIFTKSDLRTHLRNSKRRF